MSYVLMIMIMYINLCDNFIKCYKNAKRKHLMIVKQTNLINLVLKML